jgi:ABC-type transport system involved in multi-copper enzyme maturation permease subunit
MTASPSSVAAMRMIAVMSLRRARRGRMLWLSGAILLLVVGSAVISLVTGRGGLDFFEGVTDLMLRYLAPLVMLLHASSAVSEEVQARTITYLFSRPIPRWTLPMGKFAGAVLLGFAMLLPALAATYIITMLGEWYAFFPEIGKLWSGLVALALAVLLYGAVATAFGTMVTGYSFVAALFYVLIVEVGLAFAPGWLKVIAMTVHLRVIAGLYEPTTTLYMADPRLTLVASLPVVLAETLLWLFIALAWVGSSEYRTDK